jgi:hypothetical protein
MRIEKFVIPAQAARYSLPHRGRVRVGAILAQRY